MADIIITILGSILGAFIGVWLSNCSARKRFKEEREDILNALLESIHKNIGLINQIENLHLPNNEMPTFPFDTASFGYIALSARRYLPKGTNWSKKYNGLRFELDHINRKILVYLFVPNEDQLKGITTLINNVRLQLETEAEALSKLK
ncbi:MAG: hypothetical protein KDN22_02635 [Verrucomicrobiae bacterium]|nr:hypothetical protein [Verrucomicrobiae bacterium]